MHLLVNAMDASCKVASEMAGRVPDWGEEDKPGWIHM